MAEPLRTTKTKKQRRTFLLSLLPHVLSVPERCAPWRIRPERTRYPSGLCCGYETVFVAMADENAISRYRNWYAKLLRLYPKPFRERFADGMEQTFNDLCRERAQAGKGLFAFALWTFCETFVGILRESSMHNKNIIRIAIGTGCILLIPLMGNLFMGWHWPWYAFPFWGSLLFGTGLVFEFMASKRGTIAYKVAVGIACLTGFALVFVNAAAGIIGDGPVNLMYLGVIAVGVVGAFMARFHPRGMALALLATAVAQMLVPVIALLLWQAGWEEWLTSPRSPNPPFHPGVGPVFGLNAVFAAIWVASALLFGRAARQQAPTGAGAAVLT
jgi:hypothetical protein